MTKNPSIAILLAAYNGQDYLRKQLDSIVTQTYPNWTLHAIDDGSSDQTQNILQEYQARLGPQKMTVVTTKNQGCAKTFLTLVCEPTIQADYYAYSDQDDIWDADKLAKALAALASLTPNLPQLYCSGARVIDANEKPLGQLPIKKRPPSLQNALIQCIATGNTMVFNHLARKILLDAGVVNVPLHDWWTYLAICASGGECYYDMSSTLSYRQHGNNVMGFKQSFLARYLKKLNRVLNDQFIQINTSQLCALSKIETKLTPKSIHTLNYYRRSLKGNLFTRMYYLYQSGVYRQEILGTMGVYLALIIGKL
ncbi:MAG: glycosyltransferase family 2 protein [Gammaproteobacteria bacterium]